MPERSLAAPEKLRASIEPASSLSAVTISSLDEGVAFSLRMAPELASAVRNAAGFDLTAGTNRIGGSGPKLAARLGPDEWLLIAPSDSDPALESAICAALEGHFYSLVDVSSRSIALLVSGRASATVLNAGVPIDLHSSAFPPGSATRTVLGKAEITLLRPSVEPTFRVECRRSFAPYVRQFLEEAAAAANAEALRTPQSTGLS